MKQILKILCAFMLVVSFTAMTWNDEAKGSGQGADETIQPDMPCYVLEKDRWHIYDDGTHPVETTKGFNDALAWAAKNGIRQIEVPAGTYLIDKDSSIQMVSDMTFKLDDGAILKKEKNGNSYYVLMRLGPTVKNVRLTGGVYIGDRDSHDYSSGGTHEGGYGILLEGAQNIVIDGVKSEYFTGDGLCACATGQGLDALYEKDFESGAIDAKGKFVPDANKIRTSHRLSLEAPYIAIEHAFVFDHANKVAAKPFDVYFYKADGTFISSVRNQKPGQFVQVPDGASYFYAVYNMSSAKGFRLEYWSKVISKNVTVKNSEFAFNRRQGITVGGADNILIVNNKLHDMKGTAPQSGIDVEAGFYPNDHIYIKGNNFYNNHSYDLILYDGQNATVDGNIMRSYGVIGLAVSDPFNGAVIKNNVFDGTSIHVGHNVVFDHNKMNNSSAFFKGTDIKIDHMEFNDSLFSITSTEPFGITASNVTMYNKKGDAVLALWGQPVHLSHIVIKGEPKQRSLLGGVAEGSIFDDLQVIGYNSIYGLALPRGTYNDCVFEAAPGGKSGPKASYDGKYVFNGCEFKTYGDGLGIYNKDAEVTVKNSMFEVLGTASAISVHEAKRADILSNKMNALNLTGTGIAIIQINEYGDRNEPYDVAEVTIKGNTITTNVAAKGISTIYAGKGAPPYLIENNILNKAVLELKANDINRNNTRNP